MTNFIATDGKTSEAIQHVENEKHKIVRSNSFSKLFSISSKLRRTSVKSQLFVRKDTENFEPIFFPQLTTHLNGDTGSLIRQLLVLNFLQVHYSMPTAINIVRHT